MSKELSNREQKFRDEYMDILYQAIRKEHPPGKYLLLDKNDLRKLTELFKRVYQEGEYIDMNDIKEFLTKEHLQFYTDQLQAQIELDENSPLIRSMSSKYSASDSHMIVRNALIGMVEVLKKGENNENR